MIAAMPPDTLPRSYGISFSAAMIIAILEGRKTETRRVSKAAGSPLALVRPGDHLWVKEAFRVLEWDHAARLATITYRADPTGTPQVVEWPERLKMGKTGAKLPRFMPREASRIDLIVREVRTEHLYYVDDAGALAEGVDTSNPIRNIETDRDGQWLVGALRHRYLMLWDSINAERGFPSRSDPLVDVLRFEELEAA